MAITPAVAVILTTGESGVYRLLILSQVVLSLQLPFAIVPLIHFTSDRVRMGALSNGRTLKALAWTTAAVIIGLNVTLVYGTVQEWIGATGHPWLLAALVGPVLACLVALLGWVVFAPILPARLRRAVAPVAPVTVHTELLQPSYSRILVPLDHSGLDVPTVSHAAALAKANSAKIYLLHVEEDVTSQVYGALASTTEVESGTRYLYELLRGLEKQGLEAEAIVRYSTHPRAEILRVASEVGPDLVVMGAHGHKGLKDMVFGTTINAVRHRLKVPILVVREKST
jgi:manganese transport protein